MPPPAASQRKGFHDPRYRALIGKLVQARRDQGLSQRQLAERLHRHQQFVSRFETGERRLDAVEFSDVARALGVDGSALLSSVPAP